MVIKTSLLLVVVLFTAAFMPDNINSQNLLILGGANSASAEAGFLNDIDLMSKKFEGLSFYVSFNSHGMLTALKNETVGDTTPFTSQNAIEKIRSMKDDIISGKIKPGGKIFAILDGHGIPLRDHESSVHAIETLDDPNFDVSELVSLKKVAHEHHIQLAIADFSCYGGETLKLADKDTCVISATSNGRVSFDGFSNSFFKNVVQGRSLSDVFQKARSETLLPEYPQISTLAGENAEQAVKTQLLDVPVHDDHIANSPAYLLCQPHHNLYAKLQNVALATQKNLNTNLSEYQKLEQRSLQLYNKRHEIINVAGIQISIEKLANLEAVLESTKKSLATMTLSERSKAEVKLNKADLLREKRQKLLTKDRTFREVVDDQSNGASKIEQKMIRASAPIVEQERRIYQKSYSTASTRSAPNACDRYIF